MRSIEAKKLVKRMKIEKDAILSSRLERDEKIKQKIAKLEN